MYTHAAKVWALCLVQGRFLSRRAKPYEYDSLCRTKMAKVNMPASSMALTTTRSRKSVASSAPPPTATYIHAAQKVSPFFRSAVVVHLRGGMG